MLTYPNFNPVALEVGPLKVYWYGLMYIIGFCSAWGLAHLRAKRIGTPWTGDAISDLIFYGAIGVVLGGRIGYTLIYNLPGFVANPLEIFAIWHGGMSFHGGLIGVALSLIYVARKYQIPYLTVMDFTAVLVPLGLAAGRLGNFINGELWGRVTDVPWGMIYPDGGPLPRHPSELYEFALEGVLLFIILWRYSAKPRRPGAVCGLFLVAYGALRFFCEWFREPDTQIGFLYQQWLTMGQLLCVPMVLLGGYFLFFYGRHRATTV